MKLLEFIKYMKEVLKICKEEEINPNIWIESKGEIYHIDKIKLETGYNKNNKFVSNLTFITNEKKENE